MNHSVATLLVLAACIGGVRAEGPTRTPVPRLYAAVMLVRGSVVGSNVGSFGPYVLEQDTTWRRLSRSNLITFGIGSWVRDDVRRLYVAAGNGLHRSTDDGATWKIVTGWKTMEILSVLPDARDPKCLLVSSPWGIYRTTDDGATWQESMQGIRRWYVRSLVPDVDTPDVVYAMAEDDVYRSTDRGSSWRPMHAGKGSLTAFLQVPEHPRTYLAGFEDQGIRISTDGGTTWKGAVTPSQTPIYAMSASADGRVLYAAGWKSGIWQSTNGGERWQEVWRDEQIDAFFCFLIDPANPAHVYVGTDGNGVFESVDGGLHWSFAGLRGGKIKDLYLYP